MRPKEETKPIEDKSNNQSRATIIFNELINKRKDLMKKLYVSVDYNNLKFEYVGPTKDVSFYEYMDSRELFNSIKDNKISFNDVIKRQNEFLYKLSNIKISKKTPEQRETIDTLEKFIFLEKRLLIFLEIMEKWSFM